MKIKNYIFLILIFFPFMFANANQKPLKIILDWFINPNHAPMFVAQQQGYYKQMGLDVEFIPPADPSDSVKMVAAKQADIAITYQPQYLLQLKQGLPITEIGVLIATPLDSLMVLKNGPIKNITDLKGKRIGYSSAATKHIALRTMLQKYNMTLKDVNLINVHYGLTQALLTKKIDAVTGISRNFEPIEAKLAKIPVKVFYVEENGMPFYNELILVANNKNQNDPRIPKFLQALQMGIIYLFNHHEESWQTFAKNHPELNNELNRRAFFATIPRFAIRPGLIDKQQEHELLKFLD